MVGEFVIDWPRRGVVQSVFKDGAGDSGILVVERDEGVPGDERYVERNSLVGEANFGEGKLTAEVAFLKARKPLKPAAAQTLSLQSLVKDFERRKRAFDQLGYRCCSLDVEDGESCFR